MTPALLLAVLMPSAPSAAYHAVVQNGTRGDRVELVIDTDRGLLETVEAKLLTGYRPTVDGSDPLDRLVSDGRLLRVEHLPPHPHTGPVTAALFAALDRNGDGKLDAEELRAAERVLPARFDADDDGCLIPLEVVPDLPTAGPAAKGVGPTVTVVQPGGELPPGEPVARIRLRAGTGSRQRVTAAGVVLDVVVQTPADRPAVPRSLARPGREKERERFETVAASVVTLGVRPEPRGLFELLDADADGQLSVRELRAAPERLAGAVANPPTPEYSVTLASGTSGRPPMTRIARPARGPVWFRSLDRNGDGDVSRREFVGTDTQFRLYDADADALISAAEAETGDAELRQRAKP